MFNVNRVRLPPSAGNNAHGFVKSVKGDFPVKSKLKQVGN